MIFDNSESAKNMINARSINLRLEKLGSAQKADNALRFFKTGKGQYGEGDIFLGVTVPEQRQIAREARDIDLSEIKTLIESPIHECRLTALHILILKYKKGDQKERARIVKYYLASTKHINNWDLVDASAAAILGAHLLEQNRKVLYTLARRQNMWERRIAIVATHTLIRKGDYADALAIAKMLLPDKADLMHKAVGWTLREVGKHSRGALVSFLKSNAPQMPRTALRYAIEHFDETERRRFMQMK